MGQVGKRIGLGEQLDRGAVAVARDQPRPGMVAPLAWPVQVGEQAGGIAGALQVGDHGIYLERERRTGAPVSGLSRREDPRDPGFGPAGDDW
ncbi:hypothetical protein [Streptomyces sp. RTGN2]|uniref:hypothetical protein n=1 Tax=Streptomyces sp. RTGN2 TaxID=3016525 RepID=UPI002553D6B9|nr:hypothetical protein [Streptomyces sp. RTGN2]